MLFFFSAKIVFNIFTKNLLILRKQKKEKNDTPPNNKAKISKKTK
jgi:hypothetical protein